MANKKYITEEERKEAKKVAQKKYRDNNKEKIKNYYEENKVKIVESTKKYRELNKEKIITYRENNLEKIKKNEKISKEKNKDKIKITQAIYREVNKKTRYEYNKKYNKNDSIKLTRKIYMKKYREENHDKILINQKNYIKNRKINDNLFGLSIRIRCLIGNSFTRFGYKKTSRTQEILGCTFEEFRIYLESKFEPWMNWDNRGLYNGIPNFGWDIDHIIPQSSGNCVEDIISLNHHTNLQPLCSYINRNIKKDH